MKKFLQMMFRRPPGGISCAEVAEIVQSFVDDETDTETANKISAHIEDCRRCGLEVETYRKIKSSIGKRSQPIDAASLHRLRSFAERLAAGDLPPEAD